MKQPGMMFLCLVTAAVVTAGSVTTSSATAVDEYPSWDQVEAAKSSVVATAAAVATIDLALDELQTHTATLGDDAVALSAAYKQTQADYSAAAAQQTVLAVQADAASARSLDSSTRLGALGAQLYRSAGTDLSLGAFFDSTHSDDLLSRLGTMERLTEQAGQLTAEADVERNTAEALSAQAQGMAAERDRLQAEALAGLSAARAAQQAANDEIAVKQAASEVLYAQLASLKNSSADVERQYREGQTAHVQYVEQQRQAEAIASAEAPASPESPPVPPVPLAPPVPPAGTVVDRGGAQAIAATQVAARGWNTDEFKCLVQLWQRESGWRVNAYNASSGATGIPQALPGNKMATAGADWQTNPATQITWGLGYIASRYSTPCGAWVHSEEHSWY